MYHRREATWIGFEEAQKTICNLKQEVEIAEKKLLNAKRSFFKGASFKLQPEEPVSSTGCIQQKEQNPSSYFVKEALSRPTKITNINNEKQTVPKELFVTSEEIPNFLSSNLPPSEPQHLRTILKKSSLDNLLCKLSSSEDSFSTSDVKHSSSEGTSSLIASTYRGADKFRNHEIRNSEISPDTLKSKTGFINGNNMKMPSIEKIPHLSSDYIGMEWKPVSTHKSSILHNKFKPDGIKKLRDIIEQQKKKQEQYQIELEKNLSSSFELSELKNFKIQEDYSLRVEEQVISAPVRKVCLVKSLPVYKGFSAPPNKIPSGKRWRKQKTKYTIAKSSNTKNSCMSAPKRIKTVVKCESDFVSASHWKVTEKKNLIDEKEKHLNEAIEDSYSKTSLEEKLEDKKDEDELQNNNKSSEGSTFTKIAIESVLKENQLIADKDSGDSYIEDTKVESLSNEAKLYSDFTNTLHSDQNALKENKKPIKLKAVKRKAKKPPDQKLPSPKIRHYNVEKVRDYMKKKKEERKKRHQDEYKKQMYEAQKKKEGLEKLYEYHKKTVAKGKPLSPIKISQKKDILGREHENQHVSSASKSEHFLKDSDVQKINSIEEKEISRSDLRNASKEKQEEFERKEIFVKNQINLHKIRKTNPDMVHIDISVPKFTPEQERAVSPHQSKKMKDVKDSTKLSSSEQNLLRKNKKRTKFKQHNKASVETSLQESTINKTEKQNFPKPSFENEEIADIQNSFHVLDMFKSLSSVSTPSQISHIAGINADLIEKVKSTKVFLPERKSKKADALKDLVKSINIMTKPLEPFLRTKKWIEDSPHPPSTLKGRITENSEILIRHHLQPSKNIDSHLEISESANSKSSSFKEQISGIGDVSQLYAKILGRKPTTESVKHIQKDPKFANDSYGPYQQNETEDKLIEGTLELDEYVVDKNEQNSDDSHHTDMLDTSTQFSDLQKASIIPDPFNLINTWKRKPLGLSVYGRKGNESKGISVPLKYSENKVPFEEMYKSLINTSHIDFDAKPTENKSKLAEGLNTELAQGTLLSQGIDQSSFEQSTEQSVSRKDTFSDTFSKLSSQNATAISKESFVDSSENLSIKSSCISDKSLSKHSHSEKHTLTEKVPYENVSKISDSDSKKQSELINFNEQLASHEDTADHTFTKNNTISDHLRKSNADLSAVSDMLISGTINSQYSLEIETEGSNEERIEESNKDIAHDRASASGSSVSEVISVVENSKGFKSSTEGLHSNDISPKFSVHGSTDEKSNSEERVLSKSESGGSGEFSNVHDKKSTSIHSSRSSEKDSEHSVLSLKNQLQNIPSGSQNSVTIDFRQPLRLTLSNGESVQSNQGIDLQENQYLHTQVVTRVASEAAAAAATSAVIAVFETQKALLAERNYLGVLNSFGRSSSSKKTQYSSDFESSQAVKSSSRSSQTSTVESKYSKSIPESISGGSNKELSSKNGSTEEKILSEHSVENEIAELKSSQNTSVKTEENGTSIHSQEIMNESQRTPQKSKRKISGNVSSPSPASLSDNESVSSETIMSSHSNFSIQSESMVSDDSFAQLTLDVVRRMTHEEELRARHQLSLLQFQEKTLVEKARAEMKWLESHKKKLQEKGAERNITSIKRRQKELILRLRQERAQLQCMQEAYRGICEKHRSLLEDKKTLLKEPNSFTFQLISKDEKPYSSKYSDVKLKEFPKPKSSSSTPTIASDNDIKTMVDEESVSEVPEILKGLASNSSQESVVETQASEPIKTSNSSQSKSQRSSPNPSFSPVYAAQSISNPSLHSNNSLETALQGLKKLEASKRHLTKREQRLLQRRKQIESLLQWQMKLDSEEMAVRELEQKALDLVDHSKKKTKYYISSSGSANQDDDRKESIYKSLPPSGETSDQPSKISGTPSVQLSAADDKALQTPEESIPTNLSENGLEGGGTGSEKESVHQVSSVALSSDSLPEEIKSGSGESSVHTAEVTENGSHIEEAVPEEMSYLVSPSVKDKSSSSDIYSESFESSVSRKSLSVLSNSSPFKNTSSSRSIKKDSGPGIRLPLVPRNLRRHDSSGSDDSYTISQSETASDQSDIEVRIHALAEELKRRRAEAEKLKREQRKKYREQLKEKELSLQKQLEAYNQYINQAKLELEHQIESAISPPQATDLVVKPRIKWPRPEQVIDSRRVRKQAALNPDAFALEKKPEYVSSPESTENSAASVSVEKGKFVRKLFPETSSKVEDNFNRDTSEKSVAVSKEVSEALSASNSSEIQEVSEIEQSKSVSSEVSSDIKEISEANENSSNSSIKPQKLDEPKSSDADPKNSSTISSLDENRSSHETGEPKSQTDTFITESSSLKSFESNSPKQSDDSSASNRTMSSDEDQSTKVIKEISQNASQKSDSQQSQDVSQESSSLEESISEVQSVINSLSAGEELEEENLSKSSKCNSSSGCEASPRSEEPPKNEMAINITKKHEQLDFSIKSVEKQLDVSADDQLSAVTSVKDQKKLIASETEIVNIVNYISSSLIDDTVQIFYNISNQKSILGNFLSIDSTKVKVPSDSQSIREKTAETLSASLFDIYLKDTFDSFFHVIKGLKNNSENTASLSLNYNDNKCDKDTVLNPENGLSGSLNNTFTKTESTVEFQSNNRIQDINDNEILPKQAFWTTDNLDPSEREQQIQQLEQQLVLQQYSYFYRKIPNKPPPPYTPPSSSANSLSSYDFPFIKEKPIEKSTSVEEITKNIDQVVDHSVEILLDAKQKGFALSEITLPADDPISDNLELTTPNQIIFLQLVFELTKEIVLEQYSETGQFPQPWLRQRKLTPKPLISCSKDMFHSIQNEVKKALKINNGSSDINQRRNILWSSLKLGRKKRDFVDTILISELKEEEPNWVNYDQDEVTVKLQIADSIFNVLIGDTVNILKDLQLKINS